MKKSLIITIGIILILLVLGVWLYLLFFGTPENGDDVFSNLGFGNAPVVTEQTIPDELVTTETAPTIDTKDALRQLTTRSVAGFGLVSTSSYRIRYAERGTGHVYEIDAATGSEVRVSGTTIPQIVDAVFSADGTSVALVSENETERKVFAGKIPADDTNIDFLSLPADAFAPHFRDDTTLQYAIHTLIGVDGYQIDVRDEQSVRIFSIPVSDVEILWGDTIFTYNKPAALMPGALYRVNSFLTPITPQSFGFVGGVNDDYYFGSTNTAGEMNSYAIDRATDERITLAVDYIPEKCTTHPNDAGTLWCALPFTQPADSFIEEWYKGTTFSEDVLWEVEIENGSAELKVNFFTESGRYIDVDAIAVSDDGTVPVFRNKLDGTLWLYDSNIE